VRLSPPTGTPRCARPTSWPSSWTRPGPDEELKGHLDQVRQTPPAGRTRARRAGHARPGKRKLQLAEATPRDARTGRGRRRDHLAHAEAAATKLRERYQTLLSDLDKQAVGDHRRHQRPDGEGPQRGRRAHHLAVQRRKELDGQAEQRRRQIRVRVHAGDVGQAQGRPWTRSPGRGRSQVGGGPAVTAAIADADTRINRSNQEAARLRDYRERIANQLRSATGLLNDAGSLLEPLQEERPNQG